MRGHRAIIVVAAAVILSAAGGRLCADTFELRDGRTIEGTSTRQGNQLTIREPGGKMLTVAESEILRVRLTRSASEADLANSEWKRVLAESRKGEDLPAIIALQEQFVAEYPEMAAAKESLAGLRKLAQGEGGGGVKFHGQWMSRDQMATMQKQWAESAKPAIEAYQAGKLKVSLEAASAVAEREAENAQALTVAGLAAYEMNNLGLAKRYLLALAVVEPGSVLAQNNLAVIAHQQKQVGESFIRYQRALDADSKNRQVLDNITVALALYLQNGGDKNSVTFKGLSQAYGPVELRMEDQMARQGLKRVGGKWLTREEQDAANNRKASIETQIKKLEMQFKAGNDAVVQIDAKIKQAAADYDEAYTRYMAINMQAAQNGSGGPISTGRNPRGGRSGDDGATGGYLYNLRQLALQDLDHAGKEKARLDGQRTVLLNHQADYRMQGEKLTKDLADAVAENFGTQRIIDLESPN
jgi:uncharacterized protein YdbL (DUF1318 family)